MLKLYFATFCQQITLQILTFLCFQVCLCIKVALWAAKDGKEKALQQKLRGTACSETKYCQTTFAIKTTREK